MPYQPFTVEKFGGLNLVVNPVDVGAAAATDLLNVDFDELGAVRTRNGSGKINANTLSAVGYQALFPSPTNGGEIIAIRGVGGGQIDKLNGTTVTNLAAAPVSTAMALSAAALGTPTSTALYISFYDPSTPAAVTLRKFDGSTVTTGAGKPMHVATWPTSNRLVQGGFAAATDSPTGANGSRSTVFFSDPGAPDTYSAGNFVTLRPGDGETISAIVSWRELLFVFKQSAVFIFYGESIEGDGSPIFSYRRVDLLEPVMDPVILGPPGQFAVAGPDAVYFSTPLGISATTGGPPTRISDSIAPLFGSDQIHVSSSVRTGSLPVSLTWFNNRLIGSYTSVAGSQRQIVWHQPSGQWTLWAFPAKTFTTLPAGPFAVPRDFVFFPNGNDIWASGPTATDDGGTPIDWGFTSGYYALPGPDPQGRSTLRYTDVWGSGTVSIRVNTIGGRPSDVADTGGALTLGTAPVIAKTRRSRAVRGELFQHKLSGSGSVVVNRIDQWVRA